MSFLTNHRVAKQDGSFQASRWTGLAGTKPSLVLMTIASAVKVAALVACCFGGVAWAGTAKSSNTTVTGQSSSGGAKNELSALSSGSSSMGVLSSGASSSASSASSASSGTSGSSGSSDSAKIRAANRSDREALQKTADRYRSASSVTSKVEKILKLGLLGQEKRSTGKLWIASGKLRMELEGAEKSLLVINKKNLWVVTFPDARFKGAAAQVIKGETGSSQARSQAMIGLLTRGELLRHFEPTGVQSVSDGSIYFLRPKSNDAEIKRLQVKISSGGRKIDALSFWDGLDNETKFVFSGVAFGEKIDKKLFDFQPPENADVMSL